MDGVIPFCALPSGSSFAELKCVVSCEVYDGRRMAV